MWGRCGRVNQITGDPTDFPFLDTYSLFISWSRFSQVLCVWCSTNNALQALDKLTNWIEFNLGFSGVVILKGTYWKNHRVITVDGQRSGSLIKFWHLVAFPSLLLQSTSCTSLATINLGHILYSRTRENMKSNVYRFRTVSGTSNERDVLCLRAAGVA